MSWMSLENCWKMSGRKIPLKVRFIDWPNEIKYFEIMREGPDRRGFLGRLDSGERISFSKKSSGWELYYPGDEFDARAV